MNTIFEKKDFDNVNFVQLLEEDGFDIHNIGGTINPDFSNGSVYTFKNGQRQLIGENEVILTCSANTFFKTLLDVESRFNYQLFG